MDEIRNISPVVVIDQKRLGRNPRSTVGTATEIYTYLRLLYLPVRNAARSASRSCSPSTNRPGMCPRCRGLGRELVFDLDALVDWDKASAGRHQAPPLSGEELAVARHEQSVGLFDLDKPLKKSAEADTRPPPLFRKKTALKDHEGNKYFNQTWEGIVTGIKRRSSGGRDADRGSRSVEMQYFRLRPLPRVPRIPAQRPGPLGQGRGQGARRARRDGAGRPAGRSSGLSRGRSRLRSCGGRTKSSGTSSTSASATSP